MLTCLPAALCSWDFRITGAAAGPASVRFNFFTEQGGISLGPNTYTVRKHGPMSGRWTLENDGQVLADAHKPSALFRAFEIEVGNARFTLKAQSALTRSYNILSGDRAVGVIRPAHLLTRRAFIECGPEMPELAQLFAFWLAVITWRRAANDAAAARH